MKKFLFMKKCKGLDDEYIRPTINIHFFTILFMKANKKVLYFLWSLSFLLFLFILIMSFVFPYEVFNFQQKNDYNFNFVLTSCLDIQSGIKEADSFLLLYLAFSQPEHKKAYEKSLEKVEKNLVVLENSLRGESLRELNLLKSSLTSFKSSSDRLLEFHKNDPEGFKTDKYDGIAKTTIDASFSVMNSAYDIASVSLMDYGLVVNRPANIIELTLASYYWGFDEYKEKYYEQLQILNESINYYYTLPEKNQEDIRETYEEIIKNYNDLEVAGQMIIDEIEIDRSKNIADTRNILPFVIATSSVKDLASKIVTDNFPEGSDYIYILKDKMKLYNMILIIAGSLFILIFLYSIYYSTKIKN